MGEEIKQVPPQNPFNIWWSSVLESGSLSLEGFLVSVENRRADKLPSLQGRLGSAHVWWSVRSKPVALSLVAHEGSSCYLRPIAKESMPAFSLGS